ncbi:MAG: universal stress protein [Anaerolineales bacterium]|nr:universal stress protein [Anaerolineales bacterium]
MKPDIRRLLLCTNGSPDGLAALEYGTWLAGLLEAEVELLGIVESRAQAQGVTEVLDITIGDLERAGLSYRTRILAGRSETIISEQAGNENLLTVFGALGRSTWSRWIRGRSFRRILAQTPAPLLFVGSANLRLKKMLVCMGGLGYAEEVEELSLVLARRVGAAVTVLHVVDSITFDYPVAQEVKDQWQEILNTDTPQGQNLRAALERAQSQIAEADFRVRQGPVVREIVSEARDGNYDLVALGSPYSAQGLRHYFLPNVTAEVAEAVALPILSVRHREGAEG